MQSARFASFIFAFGLDNKVGLCYNMPRIKSA